MGRKVEQPLACGGQAPGLVEGAQVAQQGAGGLDAGGGRRVQPGQLGGVVRAPAGEFQGQRGEVGGQQFGRLRGGQQRLGALGPQPVAHAGAGASGASGPLRGGVLGHAARDHAGQAAGRVELLGAALAPVHHHAHPLDGQRGFGDGGRQHHLAPSLGVGQQGAALLGEGQVAVEGENDFFSLPTGRGGPGRGGVQTNTTPRQESLNPPNLPHARQEGQNVALVGVQGAAHGGGHRVFHPASRVGGQIPHLHRISPARAFHQRRAESGRQAGVQRGRHHQHAQVVAQGALHLAQQRQGEVGVQRAFVEFVQDDQPHARQFGVALQPPGQDALGDDFQPGPWPHPRLEAHARPHRLPNLLAQPLGQPRRHCPRRHPARLQHDDVLSGQPAFPQQVQRQRRAFARAGGRLQHDEGMRGEGGLDLGGDSVNRQDASGQGVRRQGHGVRMEREGKLKGMAFSAARPHIVLRRAPGAVMEEV